MRQKDGKSDLTMSVGILNACGERSTLPWFTPAQRYARWSNCHAVTKKDMGIIRASA